MSSLLRGMCLLIETFRKYSGMEGDPTTLTKGELKDLLQNELEPVLGSATDKAAVDKIFNELDENKDELVDFEEYVKFVSALTMMIGILCVTQNQGQ